MLRNIHFSKWIFSLLRTSVLSPTRHLPDLTLWVSRRLSYKKQKLHTLGVHLGSLMVWFVLLIILIFWVGVLFCFIRSCALHCLCLWIVHSWLPLQLALTLIYRQFPSSLDNLIMFIDPLVYLLPKTPKWLIFLIFWLLTYKKLIVRTKLDIYVSITMFGNNDQT